MQSTVRTIRNLDKILEDRKKDPRIKRAEEFEFQAKQLRESVSEEVFETALYNDLVTINNHIQQGNTLRARTLIEKLIDEVSERL